MGYAHVVIFTFGDGMKGMSESGIDNEDNRTSCGLSGWLDAQVKHGVLEVLGLLDSVCYK